MKQMIAFRPGRGSDHFGETPIRVPVDGRHANAHRAGPLVRSSAVFYIIFNGLRARPSEAHVARRTEAHLARPARPRVAQDPVLALRGAHPAATAPCRRNDSPGAWRARALSPRADALRAHANPAAPSFPFFYPHLMAGLCQTCSRVKTSTRTS